MANKHIDEAAAEIARSRARRAHGAVGGGAADGDPTGLIRLVTEEDQFRALVAAVEDYAIISLDASGRVTGWNEGARRIKGYEANEVLGRHFALFYPLDDIERGKAQAELAAARAAGIFTEEGWRVRKGGEKFWAKVTLTAIRDQSGAVRGFAKVTHDLTDRERAREATAELVRVQALLESAEEARREAEAAEKRMVSLVGAMSDGYCTLDEHWRFAYVNPSFARLLGTPDRDLVGASFWNEVTDSVHSNFFKNLPKLLTGMAEVEFTEVHPPTKRRFSVRAHRSGGKIVVFLRDVTA
jgi:PAS domain S-box-containing protein